MAIGISFLECEGADTQTMSTALVRTLFKYLPDRYVDALLDGDVLFRNLVYFKRLERDPRSDVSEGTHIDAPDHDVHMDNLTTGQRLTGRFAFHNTLLHIERIFCFCTSTKRDNHLEKFGNSIVEIFDADEFQKRVRRALVRRDRIRPLARPLLLAGRVAYYDKTQPAPAGFDVKNPHHLPFLKRTDFESEHEYRFIFAKRGGYELKEMIALPGYNESEGIVGKSDDQVSLEVGDIRDIAVKCA